MTRFALFLMWLLHWLPLPALAAHEQGVALLKAGLISSSDGPSPSAASGQGETSP